MTRLKIIFTSLILISIIQACQDPETYTIELPKESNQQSLKEDRSQLESNSAPEGVSIWLYDYKADFPKRNRKVNPDTLRPERLVEFINSTREGNILKIQFKQVSNDTIFVKIENSEILTQKMGSTGALVYLSTTTFTLTELNGIEYVNFAFEEGDHAIPGTYSRKYYYDLHEENKN